MSTELPDDATIDRDLRVDGFDAGESYPEHSHDDLPTAYRAGWEGRQVELESEERRDAAARAAITAEDVSRVIDPDLWRYKGEIGPAMQTARNWSLQRAERLVAAGRAPATTALRPRWAGEAAARSGRGPRGRRSGCATAALVTGSP